MFLLILLLYASQSVCALPLAEQLKQAGYVEICNTKYEAANFDALYAHFDAFIEFLQTHPSWAHKLYSAKERFIRSKERNYYSTDFFGFYDESKSNGRNQIAFYYASHFHEFIVTRYPEFKTVPAIINFFEACRDVQEPCANIFTQVAADLRLNTLLKVVKYFPAYRATQPHYDGTAFSLFLDSTDNQALLLTPYKVSYTVDDFFSPERHDSILLIPGTQLTEYDIYPTPHIVTHSGKVRYATIAFAMRPNYSAQQQKFSLLPNF